VDALGGEIGVWRAEVEVEDRAFHLRRFATPCAGPLLTGLF
jgi:hypothetical protein